jgi:hypothetical protein
MVSRRRRIINLFATYFISGAKPAVISLRAGNAALLIVLLLSMLFASALLRAQGQTPTSLPGQSAPSSGSLTASTAPGGSTLRFVEVRAFTNLTRITGEARQRSFLTDGNNNAIDLSYLEDFTFGARRVEASTNLRYTDDRRVDPERSSVQRAYLRLSGPRYEYNFGDYLVSYSRLTYNQNLKGVHIMRSAPWGYGFRLLANAGTFTDRYGSLFKDELPGKPFTRVVSGVRAEQKLGPDQTVAFNWSYGNDIVRSVPIDPRTGREPYFPISNNVVSLDTRMLLARIWTLQGEIAYSRTNPDTRAVPTHRSDYGLRFDNSVRTRAGTYEVLFTRLMPSFYAINARQVADLQDVLLRASIPVAAHLQVQGSYRRTENDLNDERPMGGTVFQSPEVRLSLRDLPGTGSTVFDIGYRERYQDQGALADRVTRAPFFEVGVPLSSGLLTVGYERRSVDDGLNANNESSANDAWISLRGVFDAADWTFIPIVRYQHNRELFDRVTSANNTRTLQGGLTLDAPQYVSFDFMFRQVGATLFQDRPLLDPSTLQPVTGPNGLPQFGIVGPSGFRRPSFRVDATYKFMNNVDHYMTLSYERNNNMYAVSGQDFLDRVMQLTLVWRFRSQ